MDTDNQAAAAETNENALSDEQATDKFTGFSTRDGERIEPAAQQPGDKPVKGGETKAKGETEQKKPDESAPGDDEEKHRKSAQERINKAVGRQRAAERRADALEQRLALVESQMRSGGTSQPAAPANQPKNDGKAPQPKDYEYGELDADYIRDLARYETRQEIEASQQRTKQQSDTASQTKAQQEHQQRLDAFYQKGVDIADDFDEVVSDQSLKISPVLGELILESEFGAQIAYAMASDSKEAKRVSAMSPPRQAAWFGIKEAELSSESSDAEEDTETGQQTGNSPSHTSPKTTKAPPPPKTKTRGSGEAQQASPATTDFAQFERLAMKQQE